VSARLLVKLRPQGAARALAARARLEPLYPEPAGFAASVELRWFVAEIADASAIQWDAAHTSVAAQLGIDESDIVFAEPDLVHYIYRNGDEHTHGVALAAAADCSSPGQDGRQGKVLGPSIAWHLDAQHSQLAAARAAVTFAEPRTRIAHIDTGYSRAHGTLPKHLLRDLERSFVEEDANPASAEDPNRRVALLDNSGHGTGTLSILAGGTSSVHGDTVLGGAPEADVLPLRVADRVVLLRTSALARAFRYAVDQQADVATLSMGGLPSEAWREAVDDAYEAGLCICAAAGNHIGALPPRTLVYPARYSRVIAVCGVMANGSPYADLKGQTLEGSHGPESAMGHAIAAYTPNIPWARFGCDTAVRLNGEGTSAATPQVAAAVALWLEKHKTVLPRDWRRVEAVRHALFVSAKSKGRAAFFGNGILQARAALDVRPVLTLPKSAESTNSFAFLRVITGIGIVEPTAQERMFNLELAQRWLLNRELQSIVPDPEGVQSLTDAQSRRVMETVLGDAHASVALRKHIASRLSIVPRKPARQIAQTKGRATKRIAAHAKPLVADKAAACSEEPPVQAPATRRLRVYAVDPSFSTNLDTTQMNEVTVGVRWEPLQPGPTGEYLSVEDIDPTGRRYNPVNLDEPKLLAQDGWSPSEGNPQFHQQMVYAVSMRTIELFERALGRPVLWRPRGNPDDPFDDGRYVPRLLVRPHEFKQANAFFSPDRIALLFGYFDADASHPSEHMPGSRVYACLSHDIIAHETTHAVLDGMHRRFNEASNPDVLAFHEAFADIIALLQHFTIPEILTNEIVRTRGDLTAESMIGSLAIQFGKTSGGRGALRDAIGRIENGVWQRLPIDPGELQRRQVPHSRGAILVAAVFDAFLACYEARVADLFRLGTGGTGVLQVGAISPDLAHRLSTEAVRTAQEMLMMCIRAIDYLPPVDVTFFEYLRALITADLEFVVEDRLNFRVAFVEAFRRRGIYPLALAFTPDEETPRTLSVDTLRWRGIDFERLSRKTQRAVTAEYDEIVDFLKSFAGEAPYLMSREALFETARSTRRRLHPRLRRAFRRAPEFAAELGVDPQQPFEVHQLHYATRLNSRGQSVPQLVVTLTQQRPLRGAIGDVFRGGSTLIIDPTVPAVKYRIGKNINSLTRQERTLAFSRAVRSDPLRAFLFAPNRPEPFQALHAFVEDGRADRSR
jgi:subtilisin family serine protease